MNKYEIHEGYAVIKLIRHQGSDISLFGSNILHSNTISLIISPAKYERRYGKDWIHEIGSSYIEVEMSQSQFLNMISSIDYKSTPATLVSLGSKYIDRPILKSIDEIAKGEMMGPIDESINKLNALIEEIRDITFSSSHISKSKRKGLLKSAENALQELQNNYQFFQDQTREEIEKIIAEAKMETYYD